MSLRAQLALLTSLLVGRHGDRRVARRVLRDAGTGFGRRSTTPCRRGRRPSATRRGLPNRPGPGGDRGERPAPDGDDPFGNTDTFFQVINTNGDVVRAPSGQAVQIPVGQSDIAVANGERVAAFLHDVTTDDGVHLRVATNPGDNGEAVQIARSLEEVDASLSGLRRILFGVSGLRRRALRRSPGCSSRSGRCGRYRS